jgi:hypothetical protein
MLPRSYPIRGPGEGTMQMTCCRQTLDREVG